KNGEMEPMRRTLLRAIPLVILTGALAVAQRGTPPDPAQMVQHHVDFLTKHLSLNAQQQQQATSIYMEEANSGKSLHDQMRTAHETLQTAIQKNDTGTIEQVSNNIGNLMAQMTMAHAKADAAPSPGYARTRLARRGPSRRFIQVTFLPPVRGQAGQLRSPCVGWPALSFFIAI